MTVLMYLVLAEEICDAAVAKFQLVIAVVVDYCCCKQTQGLATDNTCSDTVLWVSHTAAEQIAYNITRSRSIQVELGKVEGFRRNSSEC